VRHLIIISTILFFLGCINNREKETSTATDRLEVLPEPDSNLKEEYLKSKSDDQRDTVSCDKTAMDFLKLSDKTIRADFFHQLDSIRKDHYPKNDQDTAIFVDLTPKLLDKFIKDLNKDQLYKTGEFEKEYNFNIAPPQYTDSKECKDKVSLTFDKKTCSFRLIIFNEFFAEWCQESTVVYAFKINGDKIWDFGRNEAG
jgi:hypothetical protein